MISLYWSPVQIQLEATMYFAVPDRCPRPPLCAFHHSGQVDESRRNRHAALILSAAVLLGGLVGACTDRHVPTAPEGAIPPVTAGSVLVTGHCVALLAGRHIQAGEVCVLNDETRLVVTYMTTDGWNLVRTQLAVSADEPGTGEWTENRWHNPQGNPAPDQFPYQFDLHQAEETFKATFIYTVDLGDITGGVSPGVELFIVARIGRTLAGAIAKLPHPGSASTSASWT